MTILVFAGPSLPPAVRPTDDRFVYAPPAEAGDLLGLIESPPQAICLIDGVFDARPAVWHKEVLALIAVGVPVFGAASMGALRAAELDRHGMIGVGAIYRAYAQGRLTGDDEVALIHGPEELGWPALSEPLVEVRATLAAARRNGAIERAEARRLLSAARAIHFADRTWLAIVREAGISLPQELTPVRLKMMDALACLQLAATASPRTDQPAPPITCFITALAEETGCAAALAKLASTSAEKACLSGAANAR